MVLFDVPGWSVPDTPVSSGSKKRKRPAKHDEELHAAHINIEKLMSKLSASQDAAEDRPQKKKRKKGKEKQEGAPRGNNQSGEPPVQSKAHSHIVGRKNTDKTSPSSPAVETTPATANTKSKKKRKDSQRSTTEEVQISQPSPVRGEGSSGSGLTDFQSKMQNSLHGARFRWINETLYRSDSEYAHQMMRESPSVFSEYHTGFRYQVQAWPSNPVSHYISVLSRKPTRTVIVDLGCGDAALARTLQPEGFTVLSYDLVSDNAYVTEADVCTHVPLPGSEEDGEGVGTAQVVDVVVFALSLMGTNWAKSVREAWRILRKGGELRIAEVASRFTDVEAFTSLINSIGFKLKSSDDSNTHFTLFEFVKVPRKTKTDKEWNMIMSRGSILKPCEYKRR